MSVRPLSRPSAGWRRRRGLIFSALCLSLICLWLLARSPVQVPPGGGLWLTLFVSAALSSIVGFAFSPIAGAILFHVEDGYLQAVQTLLIASISIQAYSVYHLRKNISLRPLAPFLLGGATTLPAGLYIATHTDPRLLLLGVGAFLIIYGLYTVGRPPLHVPPAGRMDEVLAGALGGITGPVAAFPGAFPAILCAMKDWDKCRQRGVVQSYILIMQLASLGGLWALGGAPGGMDWSLLQYCLPALAGAHLGLKIFQQLKDRQFVLLVGVFLAISGLSMIAKCL